MFRLLAGALVLVVLAAVAGYPVYVRPQIDAVRPADAIFVVGGEAPLARYYYGLGLARDGWAPHLVLSDPAGALSDRCQDDEPGFTVECFVPDPTTTFGEARYLGRVASERGWRTVIVVTYAPHVSRARYIMHKCFDGQLIMTAAPTRLSVPYWAWLYVYQTAGYVKALFQRGC